MLINQLTIQGVPQNCCVLRIVTAQMCFRCV